MGMVVRSNVMAANANRQLGMNNSSVSKNLEKLSSGFKINRAGDDASGLAISEKMKAQIKGLETASANSQDGISLVQTAEGALTEVHSMLNRMTELATKSANGTIKDEVDREAIQKEVDALNSEIDRISQSTNFNGINLLDGSMGGGGTGATGTLTGGGTPSVTFKGEKGTQLVFAIGAAVAAGTNTATKTNGVITITIGTDGADVTNVNFTQADMDRLLKDNNITETVTLGGNIRSNTDAEAITMAAVTAADAKAASMTNAANTFSVTAGKKGTNMNALTLTIAANNANAIGATKTAGGSVAINLNTTAKYSASQINAMLSKVSGDMSVKFDGEKTSAEIATLMGNAGVATLAGGTGLAGGNGLELQVGDTSDAFNQVAVSVDDMSSTGIGTSGLDVSTSTAAKASQQTIKDAINTVSTNRANLGALQNRLEYTINNLDVSAENMTAANSRIRDTDMAKQMMDYTKMNVLTQAAQAMLAQANQQPQSILQLLQ